MKKINLVYWDSDNFGDALSSLLVEELSGQPVQHKNTTLKFFDKLKIAAKGILTWSFREFKTIALPTQQTLLGIGSIMVWAKPNSVVWGSGFMNRTDKFVGKEVVAVRGKLTDEKLKDEGHPGCSVYGDPALLLPLWVQPEPLEKNTIGLIPHWREVDYFIRHYGYRYKIIDFRTRDVKRIVDEICSCKSLLSTSLHGLIVAHSYGIPALWIKQGYIDTDGFKFHDYFSSVGIPLYDGFEDIEEILKDSVTHKGLFDKNKDKVAIRYSLAEIQRGLLRASPFPLREKYKTFCD